MDITCVPLGAGQDVGKSCVIVKFGGKTVMFDCGMHMGYHDHRKFPDFSFISSNGNFTQAIDCVIITHFHLDHCGALPYFTEVCGYNGPIYMTYPTKALLPLMLEDYRRVTSDRKGETELFSAAHIKACLAKVIAVDLRQLVKVDNELEIRAYYAGHVLGAAMFHVASRGASVVYTGDYNMTPDRHLGAAQIDKLEPDLLITESTYATTVRDSKRAREREFLNAVHTCVSAGGKVLIPVFALGRAQELCILLDEYWERMRLSIPIYFSAGLTAQANVYYKMLLTWTNQKVQDTHVKRNTFDFPHISPFDRSQLESPGPCVLFATPGMLSGGLSLEVFKKWAPFEKNMLILPGYCIAGTVGSRLQGGRKGGRLDLDKRNHVDVQCQIHQLSVSAHTDAKGIIDLIRHVAPRHVMLVHGEKPKMAILQEKIMKSFNIPCFYPPNHVTITVPVQLQAEVELSDRLIRRQVAFSEYSSGSGIQEGNVLKKRNKEILKRKSNNIHLLKAGENSVDFLDGIADASEGIWSGDQGIEYNGIGSKESIGNFPKPKYGISLEGILVDEENLKPRLLDSSEISEVFGLREQAVTFTCTYCMREEEEGIFKLSESENESEKERERERKREWERDRARESGKSTSDEKGREEREDVKFEKRKESPGELLNKRKVEGDERFLGEGKGSRPKQKTMRFELDLEKLPEEESSEGGGEQNKETHNSGKDPKFCEREDKMSEKNIEFSQERNLKKEGKGMEREERKDFQKLVVTETGCEERQGESEGTKVLQIERQKKKGRSKIHILLDCIFSELEKWLGKGVLVKKHGCISGNSFRIELIPGKNCKTEDKNVSSPSKPWQSEEDREGSGNEGWVVKLRWKLEDSVLGDRAVKILLNSTFCTKFL